MTDQRQEGNGRSVAASNKGKKRLVPGARASETERKALELAATERRLRADARSALAESREVLASKREELKRTRAALEEARRTAERRAGEVTEAERRLRSAREDVAREVRARASAEAKLERARFRIEHGNTELTAAHERLVQAHRRVKPRATRRIANLSAELAAARATAEAESKRRAELEREVEARTAAEKKATDGAARLTREIERLRVKAAEDAKDVAAARDALGAAKKDIDWLKSRLESAETADGEARAEWDEERAALTERLSSVTQELEQLQQTQKEATAALEREQEASAAARKEVDQVTAQLKAAQIDLVKQFSDGKHELEQLQEAHDGVVAELAREREASATMRSELEKLTAELDRAHAGVEAPETAPADAVEEEDSTDADESTDEDAATEEPPESEPEVAEPATVAEQSDPAPEAPAPPQRRQSQNGRQLAAVIDADLAPRERRRARAALDALRGSLNGDVVIGVALGRQGDAECLMAVTDRGLRLVGLDGQASDRVPYDRITSVRSNPGRFGRLKLRLVSDKGEIVVRGWAERVGRIDYKVRNYLWKSTVEHTL